MKITVLGSSHGNPTETAFQTSVLLEEEGHFYLLDAGEGAVGLMRRQKINPSAIEAVFITHFHMDHCASLPVFLHQSRKHRHLYPHITPEIFLPEADQVPKLLAFCELNHTVFPDDMFHFRAMRSQSYSDPVLSAHFIPTCHVAPDAEGCQRSFAVSFQTRNKKILFTGDLKGDFSDFPLEEAMQSQVLFCELTHYPLEKALEIFKTLPLERLVFYHLHDPHQTPEGREKVLNMCRSLPFETALSFDSFTIEV